MINPVNSINNKLSIYYVNDLHGNMDHLGGLINSSRFFDKKAAEKGVDTIKLSAGDNVAGADSKKNDMITSILKYIGIQNSAVGNHEVDANCDEFAANISKSGIDYVATNTEIDDNHPLDKIIKKSKIIEQNGTKYGLIGAVTPELVEKVKSKDLVAAFEKIEGPDETAVSLQKEIDSLKSQGVNRIILLSHCGYEFDKSLVSKLSGVDIVISGHSHDLVKGEVEGQNYQKDKEGKPVIIVQAGENGKFFGILDVEFDDQGTIKNVDNNVYKTDSSKSPLIKHVEDSIMGKSPVIGKIKSIDPFPENKRKEPCAWTDLVADSMRSELGVDIALINSSNTRRVPDVGELTERAVTETHPFKNKLMTTKMSERELIEALKFASKSLAEPSGEPGLLKVSGLRYKIDEQGNLLEVNFVNKEGKTEPLNIQNPSDTKIFSVAYDNYTAEAGEYPPLLIGNKEHKYYDYDKDKTLIEYVKKMPQELRENLEVHNDGRLEIVKTSQTQQPSSNMQSFLGLISRGIK